MAFDDGQIIDMLRRSYLAVDGLWFVMTEEELGLEEALGLDDQVWRIMPKIQARKAREILGLPRENPLRELGQGLALKFSAEGHEYQVLEPAAGQLEVHITACPWQKTLEKAGRLNLGVSIAQNICAREGLGWAEEFGDGIAFEMGGTMCQGAPCCEFMFRRRPIHEEH